MKGFSCTWIGKRLACLVGLQSCRVGTGLGPCRPAELLKSSSGSRQASTWVSFLLTEACQAGTELGRYPSSDQRQMRSWGRQKQGFYSCLMWCLQQHHSSTGGGMQQCAKANSRAYCIFLCTGQRGLGVLFGAIHLTLQCEHFVSLRELPFSLLLTAEKAAASSLPTLCPALSLMQPLVRGHHSGSCGGFPFVKSYQVSNSCCRGRREGTESKKLSKKYQRPHNNFWRGMEMLAFCFTFGKYQRTTVK